MTGSDLAVDLGMEIAKVGVLASSWDEGFVTRYKGRFPLALSCTREQRDEEIRTLAPDLTLTNAVWRGQPEDMRVDAIPIISRCGVRKLRGRGRAVATPHTVAAYGGVAP